MLEEISLWTNKDLGKTVFEEIYFEEKYFWENEALGKRTCQLIIFYWKFGCIFQREEKNKKKLDGCFLSQLFGTFQKLVH